MGIDKENLCIANYYLCKNEAREQGLSLLEYYKRNITLNNFEWMIIFLDNEEKIDNKLKNKIDEEVLPLRNLFVQIDKFMEITNISKDKMCFIINYYLSKTNTKNIDSMPLRTIYESTEHLIAIDILAKNYPDMFIKWEDMYGIVSIEVKSDKTKETWDNLYLTLDNEKEKAEKNEIIELIYSLEEINQDEINKEILNRLKNLLKNQLSIKF